MLGEADLLKEAEEFLDAAATYPKSVRDRVGLALVSIAASLLVLARRAGAENGSAAKH